MFQLPFCPEHLIAYVEWIRINSISFNNRTNKFDDNQYISCFINELVSHFNVFSSILVSVLINAKLITF